MLGLAMLLCTGCLSKPPADNPLLVHPDQAGTCENPVLISPGPQSPAAYAQVFEKVVSVVSEYFDIASPNRYDGRIICYPKIAPGIERPLSPGSPNARERLLATLQTIRYRCFVQIRTAEAGGYSVQVTIYRELKDDPRPQGQPGGSVFRDAQTVDRSYVVVDPIMATDDVWIPKGRETALEDVILRKIRRCQFE